MLHGGGPSRNPTDRPENLASSGEIGKPSRLVIQTSEDVRKSLADGNGRRKKYKDQNGVNSVSSWSNAVY